MNEIDSCEIIRDLLPTYLEQMTAPVTTDAINKHLKECPDCFRYYLDLQHPVDIDKTEDAAAIDCLKSLRRHTKRKIIASCAITAAVIAAILVGYLFILGTNHFNNNLLYNISVNENKIVLDGAICNERYGVSSVSINENDGVVSIRTKCVLASLFSETNFHKEYKATDTIECVQVNGTTVWENGLYIDPKVNTIYNLAMHPSCKHAQLIGSILLGNFDSYTGTVVLTGDTYGLENSFHTEITSDNETEKTEKLKHCSYVMLALDKNLNYISWQYRVDGEIIELIVTTEDASAYLGVDIAAYSVSAFALQMMCDELYLLN